MSMLNTLGVALGICATLAGSFIVIEVLFRNEVFSVSIKAIPAFLQSLFPDDESILWFKLRSQRNLYQRWDVALIYFMLIPIILTFFIGCWLFMILEIIGIYKVKTFILIIWFISVALIYMWSASMQYAIEVKSKDRRLGINGITKRMQAYPIKTMKRWFYYFISNWVRTPFETFKIWFINFVFVLLHWPACLIQIFPPLRFDLSSRKTRRYYYAGYMVIFGIASLILASLR